VPNLFTAYENNGMIRKGGNDLSCFIKWERREAGGGEIHIIFLKFFLFYFYVLARILLYYKCNQKPETI